MSQKKRHPRGASVLALVAVIDVGASLGCRRPPPPGPEKSVPQAVVVPAARAEVDAARPAQHDPCASEGDRMPLLTRWTAAQREALETAMRSGIAVLAADDCHGARLLPACHARGRYGYLASPLDTHTIDLSTDEELRVNAPSYAGTLTSDAGVRPIRVHVEIVGHLGTTRVSLGPKELVGECDGATHYVDGAAIGGATIVDKNASPAATEACSAARAADLKPPAGCGSLVSLRIHRIADPEAAVTFDHAPDGAVLNVGVCPDSMVVSRDRCVTAPTAAPHLCAFGDATECRAQCDRGDTNSCDVLAFMLWHGKGVALDMTLAATQYAGACERADRIACGTLAMFLHEGHGVPKDFAKAAALFARACSLGSAEACGNLGSVYLDGDGVDADVARGRSTLERACDAASPLACHGLARRLRNGKGFNKDAARGLKLLEDLCDGNLGASCLELARITMLGEGVPSDHARAASFCDRGCRAGDDEACVMLGLMYRQADGVPRDDVAATRLMDRACSRGNPNGCHSLGIAYEHGKGVTADPARAAQLYDQACTGKVGAACMYLADFAKTGLGVTKDPTRARALYAQACKLGEQQACAQAQ